MAWQDQLNGDSLAWLLEPDSPGARYLALRDLLDRPPDDALALIRAKQDVQGRWALDYDYSGKTWVDFGGKKQPNKWVTLRALRVLKAVG